MAESTKTEVHLEVSSGFFRIPTENLIFNITVLESQESSTTRVVEKIVEVEKIIEVEKEAPTAAQDPPPAQPITESPALAAISAPTADDFYQKTVEKVATNLSQLSDGLGDKIGGDQAPEGVEDLSSMATDLNTVLMSAKNLSAVGGGSGGGGASSAVLKELTQKLAQAQELAGGADESSDAGTETPTAAATEKITRHLFDLDATFQTMYELCTNETVKTHIQNAREKVDEIFTKNIFYDEMAPKVSGYTNDDGFFNIPMSDIYQSLSKACSDKAVVNLLKKMDKGQAEIFLDQFLPLEAPPTEEVDVAVEGAEADAPTEEKAAPPASDGGALAAILSECQGLVDKAVAGSGKDDTLAEDSGANELTDALSDAITITGSILYDATLLAKNGSLDGGDNFENTLWYKIKEVSIRYSSMLAKKSADSGLSFEDGLAAGSESVESLKAQIKEKIEAAKPKEPEPDEDAGSGEASQDDIDRLLEEMGGD